MFWRFIARFVSQNWMVKLIGWWATNVGGVYCHIVQGHKVYMRRWWIIPRFRNYPCIRLHHIMLPDSGRDLHSHPFNFRTIILSGWYVQEVPGQNWPLNFKSTRIIKCERGSTHACGYGQFHRITHVAPKGAWALFIMWGGKRDDWGFMTKRGIVNYKDYKDLGDYV
jgi:hypothetical protein